MSSRFVRLLLRAHDVVAARAFYDAVLAPGAIEIVPVPAQAAARGAPAHWVGAIGVPDVASVLRDLVARGAMALGPVQQDAHGDFATVRDAGGALIALTTAPDAALEPATVWCHLEARDAARTFATYATLFGWQPTATVDLGAPGMLQQFAWEARGASVGSYLDVSTRPGVHPQWIFHFRVASLDQAAQAVRGSGGVILADIVTPEGARVLVCDDPQGGGFALRSDLTVRV